MNIMSLCNLAAHATRRTASRRARLTGLHLARRVRSRTFARRYHPLPPRRSCHVLRGWSSSPRRCFAARRTRDARERKRERTFDSSLCAAGVSAGKTFRAHDAITPNMIFILILISPAPPVRKISPTRLRRRAAAFRSRVRTRLCTFQSSPCTFKFELDPCVLHYFSSLRVRRARGT